MRTWAEIDLDALRYNFREVKSKTTSPVMAIIKADAYGHGVNMVADTLLKEGAAWFGVATADEAIELRNLGYTTPILILGVIFPEEYHSIIEKDISFAVTSLADAKAVQKVAKSLDKKAMVHIKLDTGMGRIGFAPTIKSAEEICQISKMDSVELQGIFSHMSKADEADKTYANGQFEKFTAMCRTLEDKGVVLPIKHLANSASIHPSGYGEKRHCNLWITALGGCRRGAYQLETCNDIKIQNHSHKNS